MAKFSACGHYQAENHVANEEIVLAELEQKCVVSSVNSIELEALQSSMTVTGASGML